MAVRTVSNRGGNIIGHFPSLKVKRMVAFESLIERDYLYLLDYEADVDWFTEQPLTLEYQCDGKVRRYTPDFHVVRSNRHRLVECKPEALVNTTDNQRKFEAARAWCRTRGWEFCLATDREVRAGFRLPNVKLLTQHARHVIRPETKGRTLAILYAAQSPLSIGELLERIAPEVPPSALAGVLHLAFHHDLVIRLDEGPLSLASPVRLPSW